MFDRASDAVKVTGIICGSIILIMLIVVIGWLVDRGRDTAAIMTLVGTLVTPLFGAMLYGKLATVERQTNGAQHRLLSIVERTSDRSIQESSEE